MKQQYDFETSRLNARTKELIAGAIQILDDYQRQGFKLTVRQLYYQFVSKDWIENNQKRYKQIVNITGKGRMLGFIDWDMIEDRTRELHTISSWDGVSAIMDVCAKQYLRPVWDDQPERMEVWIEKDALAGIFEEVCDEFQVPLMSCRGYASLSEMREAGRRMMNIRRKTGQTTHVYHFGDHDPSGCDMSRDIEERLAVFSEEEPGAFSFERVCLNMDQVRQYNPPPNFAKPSDVRYKAYVRDYGTEDCWELDAMSPPVLKDLVTNRWESIVDMDAWDASHEQADEERATLVEFAEQHREDEEE